MIRVVRTWQEDGQSLCLRERLRAGAEPRSQDGTTPPALELVVGNVVLLSSAALETERAFGRRTVELLGLGVLGENTTAVAESKTGAGVAALSDVDEAQQAPSPVPSLVVGGLGFGATVAGILDALGPQQSARIVVAEKLRAVIELARAEAAGLVGDVLSDPRVSLVHADVADVVSNERALAAIMLDVDNGPHWASFRSNAKLYSPAALASMRRALRPGGVLAVWSGYPAESFVGHLRRAGFSPRVEPLTERGVVRARAYVGVAPAS